jgi:hypothetical protein
MFARRWAARAAAGQVVHKSGARWLGTPAPHATSSIPDKVVLSPIYADAETGVRLTSGRPFKRYAHQSVFPVPWSLP